MNTFKELLLRDDIQLFLMGFILIYILFIKKNKTKNCPNCGHTLPRYRIPKRMKELFWGGCTCSKCNYKVDVDFFGNILKK